MVEVLTIVLAIVGMIFLTIVYLIVIGLMVLEMPAIIVDVVWFRIKNRKLSIGARIKRIKSKKKTKVRDRSEAFKKYLKITNNIQFFSVLVFSFVFFKWDVIDEYFLYFWNHNYLIAVLFFIVCVRMLWLLSDNPKIKSDGWGIFGAACVVFLFLTVEFFGVIEILDNSIKYAGVIAVVIAFVLSLFDLFAKEDEKVVYDELKGRINKIEVSIMTFDALSKYIDLPDNLLSNLEPFRLANVYFKDAKRYYNSEKTEDCTLSCFQAEKELEHLENTITENRKEDFDNRLVQRLNAVSEKIQTQVEHIKEKYGMEISNQELFSTIEKCKKKIREVYENDNSTKESVAKFLKETIDKVEETSLALNFWINSKDKVDIIEEEYYEFLSLKYIAHLLDIDSSKADVINASLNKEITQMRKCEFDTSSDLRKSYIKIQEVFLDLKRESAILNRKIGSNWQVVDIEEGLKTFVPNYCVANEETIGLVVCSDHSKKKYESIFVDSVLFNLHNDKELILEEKNGIKGIKFASFLFCGEKAGMGKIQIYLSVNGSNVSKCLNLKIKQRLIDILKVNSLLFFPIAGISSYFGVIFFGFEKVAAGYLGSTIGFIMCSFLFVIMYLSNRPKLLALIVTTMQSKKNTLRLRRAS